MGFHQGYYVLEQVGATRYVTPLREGGSLPGIVEADDLGTYVVKFRGAARALRSRRRGHRRRTRARARHSHPDLVVVDLTRPIAEVRGPTGRSKTCSTPARHQSRRRLPTRRLRLRRQPARHRRRGRPTSSGSTRSPPMSIGPEQPQSPGLRPARVDDRPWRRPVFPALVAAPQPDRVPAAQPFDVSGHVLADLAGSIPDARPARASRSPLSSGDPCRDPRRLA